MFPSILVPLLIYSFKKGGVEAARGTLIHHYETDDRGIVNKVNLIVATQHNAAPVCMSVKKAVQGLIKGGKVKEGLLNGVEMAFRAYDPCLSCVPPMPFRGKWIWS